MPSAWLRRNVLHPCQGGTLLRTIYLATLVGPTSMPSLRSSPWILGAPHNGLAPLIWRISWRISPVTAGRPQRCFDFHRQYDLNPARCQRITVSGRTIARAPYILGNSRQTPPNINLSIEINRSLLGLARRSTLICCLSTRISASSATRDRNRSLAIPKISRHKSSIAYQHRAILSQLPARLNLRQGQGSGVDAAFEYEVEMARMDNAEKKAIEQMVLNKINNKYSSTVGGNLQKLEVHLSGERTVTSFTDDRNFEFSEGLPALNSDGLQYVSLVQAMGRTYC